MALRERIDQDMKEPAKAQDKVRLQTLRMLKSALKYREIELNKELGDTEILPVLQQLIKQRKESAEQYTAAGRPELAQGETGELKILEAYLPEQLGDAALAQLVREAMVETQASAPKDMGAVMKALMPKLQGRAEGKRVSEAVKAALTPKG